MKSTFTRDNIMSERKLAAYRKRGKNDTIRIALRWQRVSNDS